MFFAIVAAVFAEEMKMEKEVEKMEDIKMPEPEKYPPGVDEKLCPGIESLTKFSFLLIHFKIWLKCKCTNSKKKTFLDYPNCDNVLLHTPTVDVIKSIKIKGALPYETYVTYWTFQIFHECLTKISVLFYFNCRLMPAAYPYAYGAGAFYAPNIVAPTIAARTIAAPYLTYPGLTSRVLVNGLW